MRTRWKHVARRQVMKQLLERFKSNFHFESWLAEFVAVFFDRAQVGPALLTAQRLRSLAVFNRFFKRS